MHLRKTNEDEQLASRQLASRIGGRNVGGTPSPRGTLRDVMNISDGSRMGPVQGKSPIAGVVSRGAGVAEKTPGAGVLARRRRRSSPRPGTCVDTGEVCGVDTENEDPARAGLAEARLRPASDVRGHKRKAPSLRVSEASRVARDAETETPETALRRDVDELLRASEAQVALVRWRSARSAEAAAAREAGLVSLLREQAGEADRERATLADLLTETRRRAADLEADLRTANEEVNHLTEALGAAARQRAASAWRLCARAGLEKARGAANRLMKRRRIGTPDEAKEREEARGDEEREDATTTPIVAEPRARMLSEVRAELERELRPEVLAKLVGEARDDIRLAAREEAMAEMERERRTREARERLDAVGAAHAPSVPERIVMLSTAAGVRVPLATKAIAGGLAPPGSALPLDSPRVAATRESGGRDGSPSATPTAVSLPSGPISEPALHAAGGRRESSEDGGGPTSGGGGAKKKDKAATRGCQFPFSFAFASLTPDESVAAVAVPPPEPLDREASRGWFW